MTNAGKPPLAKRFRRWARAIVIQCVAGLLSRLPLRWVSHWGEELAALVWYTAPKLRRRAIASITRAFPDRSEGEWHTIGFESFRHLGRAAGEVVCVRQLDAQRAEFIDWPPADRHVMDRAIARGKGVIFVTGHVGNWELLARHVALEGYPASVIAKETSDRQTTRLIDRMRASGKLKVIWRGREGAAKAMLRALKAGEILGLLIDQDTRVQSVFVNFFGHLAKTPRAAADLALRSKAAVVCGFCVRMPDGRYRISMKEIDVPPTAGEPDIVSLTQTLTSEIESAIRAHPTQWVWVHERWKSRPTESEQMP